MQELTPLTLFLGSLKSVHTKKTYTYNLNKFLQAAGLDMGKLLAVDTQSIETSRDGPVGTECLLCHAVEVFS